MKELSIEEKAKAYDELKIKASRIYNKENDVLIMHTIEDLFPELAESEDEKIRKALINIFKKYQNPKLHLNPNKWEGLEISKILKWLEKQGDKDKLIKELGEYKAKYTQEVLEKHLNSMSNKDDERLRKTTISFLKEFADKGYENAVECIDWLEKQGEQKLTIIIPKFRVGDEIKTTNEEPLTITKIDKKGYWSEDLFICSFDEECIWDLVGHDPAENKGMNLDEEKMTPFQKKVFCIIDTTIEEEQGLKQVCDELLRLASNEIKQNSTEWSEEDEKLWLDAKSLAYEVEDRNLASWIMSLKNRVQSQSTWKPSDEQMEYLHKYAEQNNYDGAVLTDLYNDLRKLKQL